MYVTYSMEYTYIDTFMVTIYFCRDNLSAVAELLLFGAISSTASGANDKTDCVAVVPRQQNAVSLWSQAYRMGDLVCLVKLRDLISLFVWPSFGLKTDVLCRASLKVWCLDKTQAGTCR